MWMTLVLANKQKSVEKITSTNEIYMRQRCFQVNKHSGWLNGLVRDRRSHHPRLRQHKFRRSSNRCAFHLKTICRRMSSSSHLTATLIWVNRAGYQHFIHLWAATREIGLCTKKGKHFGMRLSVNFLPPVIKMKIIAKISSQTSQQFRFDDVLVLATFFKLASGFLALSNELQFHAMMPLLLNVPLLTLIVHEQQNKLFYSWEWVSWVHEAKFIFTTDIYSSAIPGTHRQYTT